MKISFFGKCNFLKKSLVSIGLFLFLFALLFSKVANSQPYVDIFNLKYQHYPEVKYKNNSELSKTANLKEASFLIPLEQKNKSVFLISCDYTRIEFQVSGDSNKSDYLQSASMALGYQWKLNNKKWESTVLLIPKFNSNLKKLEKKNFQIGGVFLLKYEKSNILKYHFGVYYNREYFGNYFIPSAGIEWTINKRMNLFGDLPNNLNFELSSTKSFIVEPKFFRI
jgi:hypothetical protein